MMKRGRTAVAHLAVAVVLAGSLLAVSAGSASADTLTERKCDVLVSGDYVRKLDVCVRGWYDTNGFITRGVVEMHTYKWVGEAGWVDSTSQSITLETAANRRNGSTKLIWGQLQTDKCRINGPGGSVGCSVPNTSRVAFYGPAMAAGYGDTWNTRSQSVSWRDDRGVPHPRRYLDIFSPPWTV
jgi:hypothetical protein